MDSTLSPETTGQTPRTQDVLPGVQSSLPQDDTGMCLENQVHTVSPQDEDLTGKTLLKAPDPVIGKGGLVSEAKVLVSQSRLALCVPMDCNPPVFPVHGILQARILEYSSPGDLSQTQRS